MNVGLTDTEGVIAIFNAPPIEVFADEYAWDKLECLDRSWLLR
jgi:hypothetical protein